MAKKRQESVRSIAGRLSRNRLRLKRNKDRIRDLSISKSKLERSIDSDVALICDRYPEKTRMKR